MKPEKQNKMKPEKQNKLFVLRFGILLLLTILVVGGGVATYLMLQSIEIKSFETVFSSCVDQISKTSARNIQNKMQGSVVLAKLISNALKTGYIGPAPNITYPGFDDIMTPFASIINARNIQFTPKVTHQTRHAWEAYAASHVDILNGPKSLKVSTGGSWTVFDGIYNRTLSGMKVRDTGYAFGSAFPTLLTPVWHVSPLSSNAAAVMHNPHSMKAGGRMKAIDSVLSTGQGAFSDIVTLTQDQTPIPSTIYYAPVFPQGSNHPNNITGLTGLIMGWDIVFNNALPSFVSGIDIVLSSASQTWTLHISNGKVTVTGVGDQHDTSVESYGEVITKSIKTLAPGSISDYSIKVYPTQEFYSAYVTNLPLVACMVVVGIVLLTTVLVLLFMYLVYKRDAAMIHAIENAEVIADYAKVDLVIDMTCVIPSYYSLFIFKCFCRRSLRSRRTS
jgi:hypothetical protein